MWVASFVVKRALELSGAKSTKNRIGMYIAVGAAPNSDQIRYEENNNFKYLLDKSIEEFSNSI